MKERAGSREEAGVERAVGLARPCGLAAPVATGLAGVERLCRSFLVVTALAPVLRRGWGAMLVPMAGTTGHLSGRSVRVLAFGLRFVFPASRMPRLRHDYGETGNTGTRSGECPREGL